MNDLISRQAAYDTLSEYYHHRTNIQHKCLREALDLVPSAQRNACEYWDDESNFCALHRPSAQHERKKISEEKMKIVIENYFKDECDVNTSIKSAFEKGFRIGVKKGMEL